MDSPTPAPGDQDGHPPAQTISSTRVESLPVADVEAMVRLVGEVCDPELAISVGDRRARLSEGLVKLVNGDAWFSCIGCAKPEDRADPMVLSIYDGGWCDEKQRMGVLGMCLDVNRARAVNEITARCFDDMQVHCNTRSMYMSDATWSGSDLRAEWNALGIDEFLISIYPMENFFHSVIGIYRHVGRPAFTARERTIAHVVWQQTEWLHRQETKYPAGADPCELSVRERQVLILLLSGMKRKAAAETLCLSEHTVGDYIKAIYRKLSVKSRAQLMAKFLPSRGKV